MPALRNVFLTAEWLDLVMLNYEVDPCLLEKRVPRGTQLDSFHGNTYVSLVGFRFCATKMFGQFAVPFHRDFDEVNLRFYVRRRAAGESRRGVVFVAEIVPRRAIAAVARLAYGENYVCLPMRHHISGADSRRAVAYEWQTKNAHSGNRWCRIDAQATSAPQLPQEGSLEQYITEHYWGYSIQRNGSSVEYHVSHVPWKVSSSTAPGFEGDATELYGSDLARIIQRPPDSAFIADGSQVTVFRGQRLP
jgi:uncharacterized protein YqjF (DUF2071 family)